MKKDEVMDCELFQELLFSVPSVSDVRIEDMDHARECDTCAAFVADLQMVEAALQPESASVVPSRVRSALLAEFRQLHPKGATTAGWPALDFLRWRPRRPLVWAVAAAVVLVLGLRFLPRSDNGGDGFVARKVFVMNAETRNPSE